MTPRPYSATTTATRNATTKNPQIIAGGVVAALLLLVAAGFGIHRMSADPLTGTWTRHSINEYQAEQQEILTINSDHTGTHVMITGDPTHVDNRPDFRRYVDNFEWHTGGSQIQVEYIVPPGQRVSAGFSTSAACKFALSNDQNTLSLEGLEGDDQPTAVFTRQ